MAYASWSVVFGEQPSAAKWNILGTNDASFNDGTGIGVSAITPEKLLTGTGTAWGWTSYTPTWTATSVNPTLGTSTLTGYYKQVGKTVFVNVQLTMASGFAVGTGTYRFALPVAANTTNIAIGTFFHASGYLLDSSASEAGIVTAGKLISSTTIEPNGGKASAFGALNNAFPYAWNNGDIIAFGAVYEAA